MLWIVLFLAAWTVASIWYMLANLGNKTGPKEP
jgi:hypothetical protein